MTHGTIETPVSEAIVDISLEAAQQDKHSRRWSPTTQCGRQGDVVISRIDPDTDLKPASKTRTRRLDRVLARGSRAMHVCTPEASVYELDNKLVIESDRTFAIIHTDVVGHRHHSHILPAGRYFVWQQVEATAEGVKQVAD